MEKTLIVVVGPTGIGKSDVSIKLAQHFGTEIISADSRQMYKELSIGTAVPSGEDLSIVKHHLIHHISVVDYYNASKFEFEVLDLLDKLFLSNNPVIITGGSMMYIDAVCKGIDDLPDVDKGIRDQLIHDLEEKGIEMLRLQLKQLDPDYYANVDLKNPKRILHALEICLMTGHPYSSFRTETIKKRSFRIIKIGLNMEREKLYDQINKRVLKMVADGLFDEAETVYHLKHLNSLNTVGYKEVFEYLDKKCSKEEAIDLIQRNSRKYARKQLTWFRKDQDIHWFEPHQTEEIIDFLNKTL